MCVAKNRTILQWKLLKGEAIQFQNKQLAWAMGIWLTWYEIQTGTTSLTLMTCKTCSTSWLSLKFRLCSNTWLIVRKTDEQICSTIHANGMIRPTRHEEEELNESCPPRNAKGLRLFRNGSHYIQTIRWKIRRNKQKQLRPMQQGCCVRAFRVVWTWEPFSFSELFCVLFREVLYK